MVISFRKGGETICDSIPTRFLCLNLIYKSLSFSLFRNIISVFFPSSSGRVPKRARLLLLGCCVQKCVSLAFFLRRRRVFCFVLCWVKRKTKNWILCETSERVATYFTFIKKTAFFAMLLINPSEKLEHSLPSCLFLLPLSSLLVILIFVTIVKTK